MRTKVRSFAARARPVAASLLVVLAPWLLAITFSEFPIDTAIGDEYADQGIVFTGDQPFITIDGSNPTSPVLSGTPQFFGRLGGNFVDPSDSSRPTVARRFVLDAGFFDSIGTTRIEWFDRAGDKLGQVANTQLAIENFVIEDSGGIASWSIGIFADEPAGYAIDNFEFELVGPSIVFRERKENDGFWFLSGDKIPGWDHVGLHIDDLMFESHPGYDPGRYVSQDGSQSADVDEFHGVQFDHILETFKHASTTANQTDVTDVAELPIELGLAQSMSGQIEMVVGSPFHQLDATSFAALRETMAIDLQKGGEGRFTCVGLLEWAAEEAGHESGEGFIPARYETIEVEDVGTIPLLTPQLLHYAMRARAWLEALQVLQGLFDPVDFLIVDPLGRRLGYLRGLGEVNEIPGAFYSGDASIEQFLIPNPLPGRYEVELVGVGAPVQGGIATADANMPIDIPLLSKKARQAMQIDVTPVAGSPGDVDLDADVDLTDLDLLRATPLVFTNAPTDPRDLNGDGIVSSCDVRALENILSPLVANCPFCSLFTRITGESKVSVKKAGSGRMSDHLDLCFGPDGWSGTDLFGNGVSGVWEAKGKKGTTVLLSLDASSTSSLTNLLERSAESVTGADVFVSSISEPKIKLKRTRKGEIRGSVKVKFAVIDTEGQERRARYRAKLSL